MDRRLLPALVAAVAFAQSAPARAEDPPAPGSTLIGYGDERGFEAAAFRPAVDNTGFLIVSGASSPGGFATDLRVDTVYVKNALQFDSPSAAVGRQTVIREQAMVHVQASISFLHWLSLGIGVPVMVRDGTAIRPFGGTTLLADALGRKENVDPVAVGDLRISPKFTVINRKWGGLSVSMVPQITVALSRGGPYRPNFAGGHGTEFHPRVFVDHDSRWVRAAVNLGLRARRGVDYLDLRPDDEFEFGAAIGAKPLDALLVAVEMFGRMSLVNPTYRDQLGLSLLGSVRYGDGRRAGGVVVGGAVGYGVIRGYLQGGLTAVATLGWSFPGIAHDESSDDAGIKPPLDHNPTPIAPGEGRQ